MATASATKLCYNSQTNLFFFSHRRFQLFRLDSQSVRFLLRSPFQRALALAPIDALQYIKVWNVWISFFSILFARWSTDPKGHKFKLDVPFHAHRTNWQWQCKQQASNASKKSTIFDSHCVSIRLSTLRHLLRWEKSWDSFESISYCSNGKLKVIESFFGSSRERVNNNSCVWNLLNGWRITILMNSSES